MWGPRANGEQDAPLRTAQGMMRLLRIPLTRGDNASHITGMAVCWLRIIALLYTFYEQPHFTQAVQNNIVQIEVSTDGQP